MDAVIIRAPGAVTPKLVEWLEQIPGTTSKISVQKSTVLGTAKIQKPLATRPLTRGQLEETKTAQTKTAFLFFSFTHSSRLIYHVCKQGAKCAATKKVPGKHQAGLYEHQTKQVQKHLHC